MRPVYILCLSLLVCLGGLSLETAHAEEDAKFAVGELRLDTERVVIFKDGYSLFVRRARAWADADGNVHTFDVPDAAVLGSFWAFSKDKQLVGMKAQFVTEKATREEPAACITILELLRANKGQLVTLGLADDQSVSGVIVDVLDREGPSRLPGAHPGVARGPGHSIRVPGQEHPPRQPSHIEHEVLRGGGQLVVFRTQLEVILPVAQVQTIAAPELKTTMVRTFESQTTRKRLQFELGKEVAGKLVDLNLMYFTPGLRWIPTYRLSGDLKDAGNLALQAEVLNEVMDLDGVAADMVVGVPHFKFREVISPLALEAQMRNVLQQAAPQLMGQSSMFSNAYFHSRAGERQDARSGGRTDIAPELAVGGSGDLFVYSIPALTLAKGARATMPLWQNSVPLSHVYTLDLALGRDARGGKTYVQRKTTQGQRNGRSRSNSDQSPLDLAEFQVWHQLQLTNDGDVPWTTGAALTMRAHLPLGQDMLTYTSIGAQALLPLTIAVDVCADYDEEEINRTPNAITWGGHKYARIHKTAKINVCNYRPEPTTMQINLGLGGKVVSASDDGVIKINDFRIDDWANNGYAGRINNHSDVVWKIELKPGETRDIAVTYEFYIRY